MNYLIALAYVEQDWERYVEIMRQLAPSLERLPYAEELRPAYDMLQPVYLRNHELDRLSRWNRIFETRSLAAHDLRGQATALSGSAILQLESGDLATSLFSSQRALELFTRIGHFNRMVFIIIQPVSIPALNKMAPSIIYFI